MAVSGPINMTIAALNASSTPTMTVMPHFDAALLARLQVGAVAAAVDGAPEIDGAPQGVGTPTAAVDGSSWFVPALALGRRDRTSQVPMVAFSQTAAGWQLRIGLDRLRGSAPESASVFPLTDYAVRLVSTQPGFAAPTFTLAFEPSPRADAVDRLVATATVDIEAVVKAMRSPGLSLQVSATAHYRERTHRPPTPTPTPTPVGPTPHPIHHPIVLNPAVLRAISASDLAANPAALRYRPVRRLGRRPSSGIVVITTTCPVNWPPIDFHFDPTVIAYYRPIYAGLPGVQTGDDGAVWAPAANGYWRAAQTYSVYNVLPDEYRLAYDTAANTPAMSVLLHELPATNGGPPNYAVRVRFRIVPWVDPKRRMALQAALAAQQYVPHPALVIGGYQGASFDMTTFLSGLGASTVSAVDGIDPAGFELVWDCTLEFYTFLCSQLAPPNPTDATAVEGRVRLALRTSDADGAAPTTIDIPVRLSLDTIAGDLVNTSLVPLPDHTLWPDGWTPALYAAVAPRPTKPMDTQVLGGSLIAVGADGQAVSAIPLSASPASLTLNGPAAASPAVAPAQAPAPSPPPGAISKNPGVVSPDARRVQQRLHDLGYDVVVDGDFGDQTEGVVRDFQTSAGLPATGVVDAATWQALFNPAPPPAPATPIAKNPGVISAAVRMVQQRLHDLGFDVVVDGDFGDQTEGVLRSYQGGAGLAVTGVIDTATWQALFVAHPPPPWPPAPPAGSALVRLDPAHPDQLADPRLIGAAELVFGQADLHIDRTQTLERIHTLAAASPLTTSVTVSSYQLAHPENLPSAHPRIFALDTEIRRGSSPSVRVTLTRETSSATASIPFSFDDIVAGLRPDQPRFDYRVRYEDPDGPGPWTDWTSFVGRQLQVTPAG
jgi:peptidoglycan hydrolase-like protein with peptidoglycan-binding domain